MVLLSPPPGGLRDDTSKAGPLPPPPASWPLSTPLHSLDTTALLHFLPSTHYSENAVCFPTCHLFSPLDYESYKGRDLVCPFTIASPGTKHDARDIGDNKC